MFCTRKFVLAIISACLCIPGFTEDKFYEAIKAGEIPALEEIIGQDPGVVNREVYMRSYPLNEAAMLGKSEVVRLLLRKGAKSGNIDSKTGNCALLDLAKSSESLKQEKLDELKKCVDAFSEYKFDFNRKNKAGANALMLAAYTEQRAKSVGLQCQFIECLVAKGAKFEENDCLLNWIFAHPRPPGAKRGEYPRLELAKTLVKCGADVNSEDEESGETPLIVLIDNERIPENKKEELARLLLENGANRRARAKNGRKPSDMVERKSPLYEILKKTREIKPGK